MRRYFFIFFLLFGTLTTPLASAQGPISPWMIASETLQLLNSGPALGAFLQKSHQQDSDPAFVYGVLHNARELNDRGLPPSPYLLKANEGLAKGIPPGQIRPALETTRRQTEEAEHLVDQAQARGLVFSTPGQRRLAIQEYQWALLNQTPPTVLRGFPPARFQPGALPGYMKAWQAEQGPPWSYGYGPGRGHGKINKDYNKIDRKGPKGHGWGTGKKDHGKNKQKF